MIKKTLLYIVIMAAFGVAQPLVASSNTSDAEKFVADVSHKALSIINSSSSRSQQMSELESLFLRSVEINWISKFVLGKKFRDLDNSIVSKFQLVYRDYLLRKYIPKFREFSQFTPMIQGSRFLGKEYYLVTSHINDPDKSVPIKVEYRLKRGSSGQFLIRDISVDGISLILTQRSEFANYLDQNSILSLISRLKSYRL